MIRMGTMRSRRLAMGMLLRRGIEPLTVKFKFYTDHRSAFNKPLFWAVCINTKLRD